MTNESAKDKIILVIEDEQSLLEAIKIKLERNDFIVTSARSCQQALSYLRDLERVDAIWLDHYLIGKEDGLDFVTQLKRHDGKWKQIPIFVVSNTASPENVQAYIKLGISKYFVKTDSQLDNIIAEIKSFLEK